MAQPLDILLVKPLIAFLAHQTYTLVCGEHLLLPFGFSAPCYRIFTSIGPQKKRRKRRQLEGGD